MILLQCTTFVMFVNVKYTRDNLFKADSYRANNLRI